MNLIELFIPIAQAAEAEKSSGVLGTLGVNWKIFLAQLFNFAIIVFILSKYVFKPIGKKLLERSEKIDIALKDAADIEKQKLEFEAWKIQAIIQAKQEASEIILQAQGQAETEKREILNKIKAEQEQIITQAKFQIGAEQKKAEQEVTNYVADMVVSATEKILKEKLDPKKDRDLIENSLKHIN